MSRGARRSWVLALLILLVGGISWWGYRGAPLPWGAHGKTDTRDVVCCLPLQPASALVHVALAKGYFEEEGIRLIVRPYVSGKRAMAAFLAGEGELVTSADIPVVFQAFRNPAVRIIAQIGSTGDFATIVARRDRGIRSPGDLKGKRIATQKASAVHFFLHMFLVRQGLSEADVNLTYMKAEALPHALAEGRIDAFSMREPFVSQAEELLGDRVTTFHAPGIYFRTEYAVMKADWIRRDPDAVRRILRALARAEQFVLTSPGAASDLVAGCLDVDPERMADVWRRYRFAVSLEQASLTALEDEARWAVKHGLVEQQEIPDFFSMMHLDGLKAVKPASVTVIH